MTHQRELSGIKWLGHPLTDVQRTYREIHRTSAYDPKQTYYNLAFNVRQGPKLSRNGGRNDPPTSYCVSNLLAGQLFTSHFNAERHQY